MPLGGVQPLGGGMNFVNTMTPGQESVLGQGSSLLTTLLCAQGGNNPFLPLSPQATADWYNQFMRPVAETQFNRTTMPRVQEAYVGPGTYWSGARANAQSQAQADFDNQQMQNIGNIYQQNRQMANQALLPFAAQLLGANTGIVYGQQGQQSGGMGGLGDLLRQLMQKQMQPQMGGGGAGFLGSNLFGQVPGLENIGAPGTPRPQGGYTSDNTSLLNDLLNPTPANYIGSNQPLGSMNSGGFDDWLLNPSAPVSLSDYSSADAWVNPDQVNQEAYSYYGW